MVLCMGLYRIHSRAIIYLCMHRYHNLDQALAFTNTAALDATYGLQEFSPTKAAPPPTTGPVAMSESPESLDSKPEGPEQTTKL